MKGVGDRLAAGAAPRETDVLGTEFSVHVRAVQTHTCPVACGHPGHSAWLPLSSQVPEPAGRGQPLSHLEAENCVGQGAPMRGEHRQLLPAPTPGLQTDF